MTFFKSTLLGILLCMLAVTAAHAGSIRDAEIEQTLKTFARPIFDEAGLSPDTVRFIILNEPDLNAFVAGGQNIFLHTGLLLETKNPDELIGVIAHESGHIAGGHLFRTQATIDDLTMQTMIANIIGMGAAIGARSGEAGMAIGSAGNSIALRQMLRHSRIQETSADQAGVRFLTGAHLPLGGFLSFMQKLSSQELLPETQQSEYVRTHPLTRDRVEFLENLVSQKPDTDKVPAAWIDLHARMKAKLQGYLFPDAAMLDKGDSVASRYGRTIATWRNGKTDEALKMLDALIKEEPENPYFQELRGQMLFEGGKIEESIAPYARATALAPKAALIRTAYARALLESRTDAAKKTDTAIKELQLSLNADARQPDAQRLLGIAYGKQGNEGQSRLHLAEEAFMTGKSDFAKKEALLAKEKLPKASPGWLRADDILDAIKKMPKKDRRDRE